MTTTFMSTKTTGINVGSMKFVRQEVEQEKTEVKVLPVNHIFWVDCSGSMYHDLPEIRKQIKNKLPTLLRENDTLTIGYFSGRGQYGFLQEEVSVEDLSDLNRIQTSVDRFLQPIGLTGFKEPLEETKGFIAKLQKKNPDSAFSIMFFSDGADNQWPESSIIKACEDLSAEISHAVVVEYGYYCNHKLMLQMAESLGGVHVQAENFPKYEPTFESFLSGTVSSAKKKLVKVENPVADVAFSLTEDRDIVVYRAVEGEILIPSDVNTVFYLSNHASFSEDVVDAQSLDKNTLQALYAQLYLLIQRMRSNEAYEVLRYLGDAYFIKTYTNAFGKQNLFALTQSVLETVKGKRSYYSEGYNPNLVPKPDQYCIVNLFSDLVSDEKARWYPQHKEFSYNLIGARRIAVQTNLTEEEMDTIQALTLKMATVGTPKELKEIQAQIEAISSGKKDITKERVYNPDGYFLDTLVWNEERPNLNVQTKFQIKLTLPENDFGIPTEFDSFEYRNYTFIKDGIVNVEKLPVSVSEKTFKVFQKEGLVSAHELYNPSAVYVLNLNSLPVINRSMVDSVSAKDTFEKSFEVLQLKAYHKVLKDHQKAVFVKTSKSFVELYGEEGTAWLKELGITDYNGYAPKTAEDKSGDVYQAIKLEIKIAGASSLPSLNAVNTKVASNKKLNCADLCMVAAINRVKNFDALKIEQEIRAVKDRLKELGNYLASVKFSLLLGQSWFQEFETEEDTKMTLSTIHGDVKFSANTKVIDVEI